MNTMAKRIIKIILKIKVFVTILGFLMHKAELQLWIARRIE